MTDQEKIGLILAEMERTAILRAAKSQALLAAVMKIAEARVQEAAGKEAQKLAEDEVVALQTEMAALEAEDQRNASALRDLQSLISRAEELSIPPSPIEPTVSEPVAEETPAEAVEETVEPTV
jgi:hypothetical protein